MHRREMAFIKDQDEEMPGIKQRKMDVPPSEKKGLERKRKEEKKKRRMKKEEEKLLAKLKKKEKLTGEPKVPREPDGPPPSHRQSAASTRGQWGRWSKEEWDQWNAEKRGQHWKQKSWRFWTGYIQPKEESQEQEDEEEKEVEETSKRPKIAFEDRRLKHLDLTRGRMGQPHQPQAVVIHHAKRKLMSFRSCSKLKKERRRWRRGASRSGRADEVWWLSSKAIPRFPSKQELLARSGHVRIWLWTQVQVTPHCQLVFCLVSQWRHQKDTKSLPWQMGEICQSLGRKRFPWKTTWAHLLTRGERHVFMASPIDMQTLPSQRSRPHIPPETRQMSQIAMPATHNRHEHIFWHVEKDTFLRLSP